MNSLKYYNRNAPVVIMTIQQRASHQNTLYDSCLFYFSYASLGQQLHATLKFWIQTFPDRPWARISSQQFLVGRPPAAEYGTIFFRVLTTDIPFVRLWVHSSVINCRCVLLFASFFLLPKQNGLSHFHIIFLFLFLFSNSFRFDYRSDDRMKCHCPESVPISQISAD